MASLAAYGLGIHLLVSKPIWNSSPLQESDRLIQTAIPLIGLMLISVGCECFYFFLPGKSRADQKVEKRSVIVDSWPGRTLGLIFFYVGCSSFARPWKDLMNHEGYLDNGIRYGGAALYLLTGYFILRRYFCGLISTLKRNYPKTLVFRDQEDEPQSEEKPADKQGPLLIGTPLEAFR